MADRPTEQSEPNTPVLHNEHFLPKEWAPRAGRAVASGADLKPASAAKPLDPKELVVSTTGLYGQQLADAPGMRLTLAQLESQPAGGNKRVEGNDVKPIAASEKKPEIVHMPDGHAVEYNEPEPPYKHLWDDGTQVVTIADVHPILDHAKDLVIKMMDEIGKVKDGKDNFLVLELLPKGMQDKVNALYPPASDQKAHEEIEKFLEKQTPFEGFAKKYMDIIDAAVKAGVKIICPEPKEPENDRDPGGFNNALENLSSKSNDDLRALLDPKSSPETIAKAEKNIEQELEKNPSVFGQEQISSFFSSLKEMRSTDPPPEPIKLPGDEDKVVGMITLGWRNAVWSKITADLVQQNPGARVIMFAGNGHFHDPRARTVTELLAEKSITSKQFGFTEIGQ